MHARIVLSGEVASFGALYFYDACTQIRQLPSGERRRDRVFEANDCDAGERLHVKRTAAGRVHARQCKTG